MPAPRIFFFLRGMKAGKMGSVSQSEHIIHFTLSKGAASNMVTTSTIFLSVHVGRFT